MDKLLAECKQCPPDGMILTVGSIGPAKVTGRWPTSSPPSGGHSHDHLQPHGHFLHGSSAGHPHGEKVFRGLDAGSSAGWPTGCKMLRTIWDMKNTRICVINGNKTRGRAAGRDRNHAAPHSAGPLDRGGGQAGGNRRGAGDGRRVYQDGEKIVEPKPQDVLNAAKNYFVAKRIMAAEKCNGISLNCLGLVANRRIPCPPCMAWQRLNNEGSVGALRVRLERGHFHAAMRACYADGRASSRTRSRTPSTARSWAPIARRPAKLRGFDKPRRAGDPPQPQRVGHRRLAASHLPGGRSR